MEIHLMSEPSDIAALEWMKEHRSTPRLSPLTQDRLDWRTTPFPRTLYLT